jgi:hypothetical protein
MPTTKMLTVAMRYGCQRADDRQRKYQQKHRILQRADVLPDEADQNDADHVKQGHCTFMPPALRPHRRSEDGKSDVNPAEREQTPACGTQVHLESAGKPRQSGSDKYSDDSQ